MVWFFGWGLFSWTFCIGFSCWCGRVGAWGWGRCSWVAFYFLVHKAFGKSYMSFLRMTAKPYVIYLFLLFIVRVCPIQVENMVIGLVVKVLIVGAAYSMLMLIMGEFQNFKYSYKILLKKK